jgi:hypothetical protein
MGMGDARYPGWPFGQPWALIRYPFRVARAIPENPSGTDNIPSESGSTQHLYRTRNKGIFVLLSPAILFFQNFAINTHNALKTNMEPRTARIIRMHGPSVASVQSVIKKKIFARRRKAHEVF